MNLGVDVGDSYDYELIIFWAGIILPLLVTWFIDVFCIVFLLINSSWRYCSPSIHPVLQLPPVLGQISLHVIFKTFMAESNSRSQVLLHLSQGWKTGSNLSIELTFTFFWVYNLKQRKRKRQHFKMETSVARPPPNLSMPHTERRGHFICQQYKAIECLPWILVPSLGIPKQLKPCCKATKKHFAKAASIIGLGAAMKNWNCGECNAGWKVVLQQIS